MLRDLVRARRGTRTLRQAAHDSALSTDTLRRLERDKVSHITWRTLLKLSVWLGMPITQLVEHMHQLQGRHSNSD